MSDFVSPAAGPVALPAKVAAPSMLAPGVPSLAAFIDLMIGKLVPPAVAAAPGKGERQGDAESGKMLPDDDRKSPVDPAFAWLFAIPAIPTPQPAAAPLPQTAAALATSVGLDLPPVPTPRPGGEQPAVGGGVEQPIGEPTAKSTAVSIGPVAPQAPAPQPIALAITPPPAAAAPALFALAMTPVRDVREENVTPPQPAHAPPLPHTDIATPVQPTGDAQRQSLDLGARDWPQKMIDHIETLRDHANANDTAIRLKPEVLGRVDVALKIHTDGAVSVRFTAEQPATRMLLIDAAPQLTAAAEARGIRLSGTSVDLGGQGDQRPRPEVERQQNIANRLTAARGEDIRAVEDGRIA